MTVGELKDALKWHLDDTKVFICGDKANVHTIDRVIESESDADGTIVYLVKGKAHA